MVGNRGAQLRGDPVEENVVAKKKPHIKKRDDREMSRKNAPLRPAKDAWQLDTTKLGIEAVVEMIVAESEGRKLVKR